MQLADNTNPTTLWGFEIHWFVSKVSQTWEQFLPNRSSFLTPDYHHMVLGNFHGFFASLLTEGPAPLFLYF